MTSNSTKVGTFFDTKWKLYQEAVRGDLLCHAEMFALLNRFLTARFGDRSFALADLGCGDASAIAETMRAHSITHYIGVDAGRDLIDAAARTLDPFDCQKTLICQDMVTAVTNFHSEVDVILCSYSVHHVLPGQKRKFLEDCHSQLKNPGYLILIDGIRMDGESREAWLNRLDRRIQEKVPVFTDDDRAAIMKHPHESDYPETIATFREMANSTSWQSFEVLMLRDDFLAFMVFRKE